MTKKKEVTEPVQDEPKVDVVVKTEEAPKEPEFVTRLKAEESQLNERATKLAEYIYSGKANTLDRKMQILLKKQSRLMQEYLGVLRERIQLL